MNILTRYCFLLVFLTLMLETIESEDIYKLIRPYKYYQRRPSKWPRLHPRHKSSRFYRFGRIPREDYYSRKPSYHRYRSSKNDLDGWVENQPCTIVIQLPRGDDKYVYNNYPERKRNSERNSVPFYVPENDYFDEEEEMESKVVDVSNKRVQIKMIKGRNPKLHIKITKSDDENDIRIMDKRSVTGMNLPVLPKMRSRWTMPVLQWRKN